MRSINRTLLLVAAVVVVVIKVQAQDNVNFNQLPSTCIREIPDAVRTALNNEITVRIKNSSLSLETTKALKDAITALYEGKPTVNAESRKKIIEIGSPSLPIIAEALLSQDDNTRNNAMLALGCLQPLRRGGATESTSDQNLRILLLRVGIIDKSLNVRRNAIRYLARIGYADPRNIPEGVLAGINSAIDDPDPHLKRIAETEKEALTLAAEVAQSRSEDLPDMSGVFGPSQNK